jgi:hypothetical protein
MEGRVVISIAADPNTWTIGGLCSSSADLVCVLPAGDVEDDLDARLVPG